MEDITSCSKEKVMIEKVMIVRVHLLVTWKIEPLGRGDQKYLYFQPALTLNHKANLLNISKEKVMVRIHLRLVEKRKGSRQVEDRTLLDRKLLHFQPLSTP